jgi:6-bladed beta-propeller/NHL repeat
MGEPFLVPAGTSAEELDAMVQEAPRAAIGPFTDADAAAELPHSNLNRDEAAELLTAVFPSALEEAAGVFDGLEVEKFRSDHVAVVGSDEPGEPPGLLTSLLPLRDESTDGVKEQVDLGLEPVTGDLQPANPLVEVEIPSELEEGVAELPGEGVSISLAGDSERTATTIAGDAAFYPNVARDSDLVVLPTPTGLETLTQLRSPDAPTTQSFDLDIPSGSTLEASDDGGAVVTSNGEPIIVVRPPTAMDAEGAPVLVTMEVSGNTISLHVSPSPESVYPILVDPLFESWEWMNYNAATGMYSDWRPATTQDAYIKATNWNNHTGKHGLNLWAAHAVVSPPAQASWNYYVPRYFTDYAALEERPTSFIRNMTLSQVYFIKDQPFAAMVNPHMTAGLWDSNKETFSSVATNNGVQVPWTNATIYLKNDGEYTTVKNGGTSLTTYESISYPRQGYVGQAVVELGDKDLPSWASLFGPGGWVNGTASPLSYEAADSGLGVFSMQVKAPRASGGSALFTTSNQCVGNASNPCPRKATTSTRTLVYDPKLMAQGENVISVTATDPIGNQSVATPAKVKVDHSTPILGVSGTATEQGAIGTNLPEYTLNYSASDGDDAAAAALAPFGSPGTGSGQLERPQGVAVDSEGNVWVIDRINNRVVAYDKTGSFLRQIGTPGTGDGQINEPRGIAVAPNGNIWIAEAGSNKRVQQFTPSGTFVSKVTNVAFAEPWGVATGPEGALWVTDPGSKKVFIYKESGTLVRTISNVSGFNLVPYGLDLDRFGNAWIALQGSNSVLALNPNGGIVESFGGLGSQPGQFNAPFDIAVADSGNILVTDDLNNRVQVFKPDGSFLRQFGSVGSGSGQFNQPRGIDVGPGNSAVIADSGNKRIARWAHADQDPQSGAAKVEIKVDGTSVKSQAPGCATKNCAVSGSWILKTDDFPAGQHKVEVIATDGVGLSTTKTLQVETHGDLQAPTIALSGSMTQQAALGTTRPTYTLGVKATDPGLPEERKSGVAATTIEVDGKVVDSVSPGCPAGGCSIVREWRLDSSSYAVGPHAVKVTATDAVGRSSTKTFEINIARDTTAPTFELENAFYTAPEGWLEQKTYNYNARALDSDGYGATSMTLKIDGEVIKSASGSCQGGGCSKSFGFAGIGVEIDMSKYDGGAHPAELTATDGAGNTRKRSWTINVVPAGQVPPTEATDTMEAVEETAPEITELTPVNGLVTEAPGEEGSNPQLVLEEGQLQSEGAPAPSIISLNPEDGFAVETAALSEEDVMHDESIEIAPLETSPAASDAEITDGSAAVISNSSAGTDTILRPAYDGLMTFKAIREASAPESYSWVVTVGPEETLKLIDSQHAALFWDDGTQGLLITAQPAHGADGETIPTSLSVSEGNVITQTVHHRNGGFVYPAVAGVGWEGGFHTEQAEVHNPAEEAPEEIMSRGVLGPPVPYLMNAGDPGAGEASASVVKYKYLKTFRFEQCSLKGTPYECGDWMQALKGFFWYNYKWAWYPGQRDPRCPNDGTVGVSVDYHVCEWVGKQKAWYETPGEHITAQVLYKIHYTLKGTIVDGRHMSVYAYPSGYANEHDTDCICNPST